MEERNRQFEELTKKFKQRFEFDLSELVPKLCKEKNMEAHLETFVSSSKFETYDLISANPKVCFVALEPNYGTDSTYNQNMFFYPFTGSQRTILLHYIAYLIAGKQFNYLITDICKTPMSSELGGKIRKDLYSFQNNNIPSWYSLFENEMDVLGNPRIICLGKTPEKLLKKNANDLKTESVYHYGDLGFMRISKEYDQLEDSIKYDDDFALLLIKNLKSFAGVLFEKLCSDPQKIQNKLNSLFPDDKIDVRLLKIYTVYQNQLKFENE